MLKCCKTISVLVLICGLTVSGCSGQAPASPETGLASTSNPQSAFSEQVPVSPETRQDTIIGPPSIQDDEARAHELKSVITQIQDTSLAFYWFRFYDSDGQCVKTLRSGQFELKHPIYQLDLPVYDPKDKKYYDYYYFKPLEDINYETEELTPLVNRTKKIQELQSLRKYGMVVKEPEKATHIIAKLNSEYTYQFHMVTQPAGKYLCKVENATVVDDLAWAKIHDYVKKSLLDCAYITIYNHLGKVYQEVIVPDRYVEFALVSDDGRYLLCETTIVVDDRDGPVEETGYLVIDLETNKIDYLSRPEFRQARAYNIIFADGYFQMTFDIFSDIEIMSNRLLVHPYSRTFYIKTYLRDIPDKKLVWGKSFMRYEGIKENIREFKKYNY